MQEDASPQGLPCVASVAVYFPPNIYQLLAVALGGPANLMNALSSSSVDVQVNDGNTGMRYRGRISDILPAPDPFLDAVSNDHSSAQDAGVTSQFHENKYPRYEVPSFTCWEHATTTPDTGSPGFESAFGDLNGQAALQVHHPVSPLELPSTMWPFLPWASSSTLPFNAQPFLDGNVTLPNIPFQDPEVSHNSDHEIRSACRHQTQQPRCPQAYVGALVDEGLVDGNTSNDCIHVHTCNREDSFCGHWVEVDRHSRIVDQVDGNSSHIPRAQNSFPGAVFNDHSSAQNAGVTSQLYENTCLRYQAPSSMCWEHVTRTPDTGSPGFELALGDLNDQAALQFHPVLSPELPSAMRLILPSTSSSTDTLPFNAQPSLDIDATLPNIPFQDRQVSHNSEHEIQSVRGRQIQQPGCPRAYVIDGLLVDEDVIDGNTNDGFIHVHPCNREDSLCGLWVKADRRSIMRHGQRWHRDARSGGDRSITCPWSGCHRKMRANDIPRHILSAHFGVTWVCRDTECSKVFNRQDSFVAHANKGGCLGAGLGAIVRYDNNDTRLINIHNVLRPSS